MVKTQSILLLKCTVYRYIHLCTNNFPLVKTDRHYQISWKCVHLCDGIVCATLKYIIDIIILYNIHVSIPCVVSVWACMRVWLYDSRIMLMPLFSLS